MIRTYFFGFFDLIENNLFLIGLALLLALLFGSFFRLIRYYMLDFGMPYVKSSIIAAILIAVICFIFYERGVVEWICQFSTWY
ncbi:hypothetical protein SAMN05660649_04817 [Desulfotomaculum arcticum]|uniref:Uncharacterized protein n=1 Tax=Desulfotruncus arcticus DSM 17038 TaxID=1121424 RepID=A0A1I2Z8J5_9FIRM|nr:hypothetical protein SAMN05660649_04817 [Desulfotomaculum arcticum] [Desulfotruncus arcticus DSM 17038]